MSNRTTARSAPAQAAASPRTSHELDLRPVPRDVDGSPLLAAADAAQLLAHALDGSGDEDPIKAGLLAVCHDLEIWRALVIIGSDGGRGALARAAVCAALLHVQARLQVLAELHRRQTAALKERVMELAIRG